MKVLVAADRLELGGTQVNSIELAAAVRDRHGIEVVFAATPGPAAALARERGLTVQPLPDARHQPWSARIREIDRLIRQHNVDLVHAWDWSQCLDCYPSTSLRRRVPTLCTVMTMVVPSLIPRQLPTTFGTRDLVEQARAVRRGPVELLEPPVDLRANAPGAVSSRDFRIRFGLTSDEIVIGIVGRLEYWRKLEGVLRAIDAVDRLAFEHAVRLLVVGEGAAETEVARRAEQVAARHGRPVVTLTGGLVDPRPAYDASDIMLGMGGSALRSMAFAKPLVVLGERGFSRPLDASTSAVFRHQGWYGLGAGEPDDLAGQLMPLLASARLRATNGALGRRIVVADYALDDAADKVVDIYHRIMRAAGSPVAAVAEGMRSVALIAAGRAPAAVQAPLRRLREVVR